MDTNLKESEVYIFNLYHEPNTDELDEVIIMSKKDLLYS